MRVYLVEARWAPMLGGRGEMSYATAMTNRLYYGDNLSVLREHVKDESVDLVNLDPPFNSNANYNILFKSPAGTQFDAQIEAFEDTWHWNDKAESAFDQVARSGNTKAFSLNARGAFPLRALMMRSAHAW